MNSILCTTHASAFHIDTMLADRTYELVPESEWGISGVQVNQAEATAEDLNQSIILYFILM